MPRPKTAAADFKKLMLRLPETVLEDCRKHAVRNKRSMNAQINYVLEEWIEKEKQTHDSHRSRRH